MTGLRRIQSQGTENRLDSDRPAGCHSRRLSITRRSGVVPHVSRPRRMTEHHHDDAQPSSKLSSRRASLDLHSRRPSLPGRHVPDSKSRNASRRGSTSRPSSRSRPSQSTPLERASSSGMTRGARKDGSPDKQADDKVSKVLAQISSLKRHVSKGSDITHDTNSTEKLSADSSASPPASSEMAEPHFPSRVIEFATNASLNAPRPSSRVVPPPPVRRVSVDSIDSFTPLPPIENKTSNKSATGTPVGSLLEFNQSLSALVFCGDEEKKGRSRRPKCIPPLDNDRSAQPNSKTTKPKPLSAFQEIKDPESPPPPVRLVVQQVPMKEIVTNQKKMCRSKMPPPPPPLARRQTSEQSAHKENATLSAAVQTSASKINPPPPPPRKNTITTQPLKSALRTTRRSLQQSEPDLQGLNQSHVSLNNDGSFDDNSNHNEASHPNNSSLTSLHQSLMSLNHSDKDLHLSKSEPNGLNSGLDSCNSGRSDKQKGHRKLSSFFGRRCSVGAATPVVSRPSSTSPPPPPQLEVKAQATEPNAALPPSSTSTPKSKLLNQDRRHASHVVNMPYNDPTYGDSGLYTGEIDAFKRPHGKGKMKYENGIFFEGKWENGVQETKAAMNRQRILSGFSSWKGQPKNGGATKGCTVYGMDWIDFRGMAGKYTGDVNEDNIPDGKGIMKYDFGLIAEGEWIKGVLNIGSSEGQMAGGATIVPGGTIVPVGAGGTVMGGRMSGNGIPGGMSVVGGAGMSVVSGLGMMSISGNAGMGGGIPMMNHMMNAPYPQMGGGMMMPQMQMGQYCMPHPYDHSTMRSE